MYLRVFRTFLSGFVHFGVDFMVFWSRKPALRAFRGGHGETEPTASSRRRGGSFVFQAQGGQAGEGRQPSLGGTIPKNENSSV